MKYYKKKIHISIIIPVHGKFFYFKKCIDSLVNQNFKNIEILIYSDGNTHSFNKKAIRLIRPYSNIKLFFSNKKKGIVNALNILINESRGKYIARMDGDDVCGKDRLEKQFMYAENHSKNFIFSSGCFLIDKNSKLIGELIPDFINLNLLKKKNPLIHPTLFAHRDIFKKILYREIYLSEDYDFYYRALLLNFKFKIIKEPLIFYRIYIKKNILSYYLGMISLIYLRRSIQNNRILNVRFLNELLNKKKKEFNSKIYKIFRNFYFNIINKKNIITRVLFSLLFIIKNKYLFLEIINRILILQIPFSQKKLEHKKRSHKSRLTKKNELISVIVPTRNSEKTIKKTIISILKQDYENIEIIVVDDGSDDNTLNILAEFSYKITLIKLNKKVLAGEARNEGIKKSNGDLIAFCDSDDIWHENKISEQFNFIIKNNLNIVCCNAISERKNIKKPMYINFPYTEINFRDLLSKNYVINSSVLLKKNILNNVNMYPESKFFFSFEDYFLWIKISLFYKIGFLDKDLLTYTDNPRFSARNNSLPFYQIKMRILFYFIIDFLFGKFSFNNLLKIIKVYLVNIFQFIFSIK
jgi:teichuronic acid biosynthesis glycosyltransferase TuaG